MQQFEAMLAKISKQIDAEMKLLEHGDGSALATALSEASVSWFKQFLPGLLIHFHGFLMGNPAIDPKFPKRILLFHLGEVALLLVIFRIVLLVVFA